MNLVEIERLIFNYNISKIEFKNKLKDLALICNQLYFKLKCDIHSKIKKELTFLRFKTVCHRPVKIIICQTPFKLGVLLSFNETDFT